MVITKQQDSVFSVISVVKIIQVVKNKIYSIYEKQRFDGYGIGYVRTGGLQ